MTLASLAKEIGAQLLKKKQTLSVAESCTGGLLASTITNVLGASRYFERGVVTYSNPSKEDLLDVSSQTLEEQGAVSRETALEMVKGIQKSAKTDYAIAVTGIAGPDGGSKEKPVGTVFIAVAGGGEIKAEEFHFHGERVVFKEKTVEAALQMLKKLLK